MTRLIDLTGQRFGRLVVLRRDGSYFGRAAWLCQCDCGTMKTVDGNQLRRGLVISCSCWRDQSASLRAKSANYPKRYYEAHPELKRSDEQKKETTRASRTAARSKLADWYVRHVISGDSGIRHVDIPKGLVELKREQLSLKRLAKQLKQAATKGQK